MDLLTAFGTAQLNELRRRFDAAGTMTREKFMVEGLRCLGLDIKDETPAVSKCSAMLDELFARADVDTLGRIKWDGLTTALVGTDSMDLESAAPDTMALMAERKSYRFVEHTKPIANVPADLLHMKRVRMLPSLSMFAACFEGIAAVGFFKLVHEDARIDQKGLEYVGGLYTGTSEADSTMEAIDVAYIESAMVLVVSSGRFSLQFWDVSGLVRKSKQLDAEDEGGSKRSLVDNKLYAALSAAVNENDGDGAMVGDIAAATTAAGATAAKPKPRAAAGAAAGAAASGADGFDASAAAGVTDFDHRKSLLKLLTGKGFGMLNDLHTMVPHHHLAYVPDGDRLLATTVTGEIYVYHTHVVRSDWSKVDITNKLLGTLRLHEGPITEFLFMPDLGLLATSGIDATVALWAVRGLPDGVGGRRGTHAATTNLEAFRTPGQAAAGIFLHRHFKDRHKKGVHTMCLLTSVRMLVTGGHEGVLHVFDLLRGDGVYSCALEGHSAPIVSISSLEAVDQPLCLSRPAHERAAESAGDSSAIPTSAAMVHLAQFVSLDASGEMRWWTLSRNAAVMDDERCLQVFRPAGVFVANPAQAPRLLINCRLTRAEPDTEGSTTGPVVMTEVAKALFGRQTVAGLATDPATGGDGTARSTGAAATAAAPASARGPGAATARGSPAKPHGHGGLHTPTAGAPPRRKGADPLGAALVSVGPRWHVFEARSLRTSAAAVDAITIHKPTSTIMAFCDRSCRVFDMFTGQLVAVRTGVLPARASAARILQDPLHRRLFVGCQDGSLAAIHGSAGTFLRIVAHHDSDVVDAVYDDENGHIISVGLDGTLKVVDEQKLAAFMHSADASLDTPLVRARRFLLRQRKHANGAGAQITSVAYSVATSCIATGDGFGGIRIWDYESLQLQSSLTGHDSEVISLRYFTGTDHLLSADVRGLLHVWSVPREAEPSCALSWVASPRGNALASCDMRGPAAPGRTDRPLSPLMASLAATGDPGTPTSASKQGYIRQRLSSIAPVAVSAPAENLHCVELFEPPRGSVMDSTNYPWVVTADDGGHVAWWSLRVLATGIVEGARTVMPRIREVLPDDYRQRQRGYNPKTVVCYANDGQVLPLPASAPDDPADALVGSARVGSAGTRAGSPSRPGTASSVPSAPPPRTKRLLSLVPRSRITTATGAGIGRVPKVEFEPSAPVAVMTASSSYASTIRGTKVKVMAVARAHGYFESTVDHASRVGDAPPSPSRSPLRERHWYGEPVHATTQLRDFVGNAWLVTMGSDGKTCGFSEPGRCWGRVSSAAGCVTAATAASSTEGLSGRVSSGSADLPLWQVDGSADRWIPPMTAAELAAYRARKAAVQLQKVRDELFKVTSHAKAASILVQARALGVGTARARFHGGGEARAHRGTPASTERAEAAIIRAKFLSDLTPVIRPKTEVEKAREALLDDYERSQRRGSVMHGSLIDTLTNTLAITSPQALPHLHIAKPTQTLADRLADGSGDGVVVVGPMTTSHVATPVGGSVASTVGTSMASPTTATAALRLPHSPLRRAGVAASAPASTTPRLAAARLAATRKADRILEACDAAAVSSPGAASAHIGVDDDEATATEDYGFSGTSSAAPPPPIDIIRNVMERLKQASTGTSVTAALRQRNPKLMAAIARMRGEQRSGAGYRSMDAEEIRRRALGNPLPTDIPTIESREDKFMRTVALDALADFSRIHKTQAAADMSGRRDSVADTVAPAAAATSPAPASGAGVGGASGAARPGTPSRPASKGSVKRPPAAAAASRKTLSGLEAYYAKQASDSSPHNIATVVLPETFLAMSSQNRVGGEFRRDVDVLRELMVCIDPDNTGTLSFDALVSTLVRGPAHFAHMRRHLEILFRSADKHGTGILSVTDFTKVIFPKAATDAKNLKEIVGYITYRGPLPEQLRAEYIRHNPEAMSMLRSLFDAYDTDGSGTIDVPELETAFKAVRAMYEADGIEMGQDGEDGIAEFMSALDASGDGEVSFDEFVVAVGPYVV